MNATRSAFSCRASNLQGNGKVYVTNRTLPWRHQCPFVSPPQPPFAPSLLRGSSPPPFRSLALRFVCGVLFGLNPVQQLFRPFPQIVSFRSESVRAEDELEESFVNHTHKSGGGRFLDVWGGGYRYGFTVKVSRGCLMDRPHRVRSPWRGVTYPRRRLTREWKHRCYQPDPAMATCALEIRSVCHMKIDSTAVS
jgi:hypothetical protein